MNEKIIFFFEQYSLLLLLFISTLGWGRLLTEKLFTSSRVPTTSRVVLRATAGLGLVTLLFILAGATGNLSAVPLAVTIIVGILMFLVQLRPLSGTFDMPLKGARIGNLSPTLSILVMVAVVSYLMTPLVRALQVPIQWDELMYHLPMAKAWADSGSLVVVDWLRYPLFPFNMEILYAGALIFGNDVTPHLVHAFTGLVTVALTYSVARLFLPMALALLSAFLLLTSLEMALYSADIDMGLMLYIFCAFVALGFSFKEGRRGFIFLAAFYIGLALGTKYQAMLYLPALALCFILIERNWKVLGLAVLVAAVIGGYWYTRNYMVSGDPIHPIGGPVFGYWLWNAEDIGRQFGQLKTVRGLPPWYLLISVGSLIFWRSAPLVLKGCMSAAILSVLVWFVISGYDRYLMPGYPLLAILSGYFIHRVLEKINAYEFASRHWDLIGQTPRLTLGIIVLLAIVGSSWKSTLKRARLVLIEPVARETFLKEMFPGYELLSLIDKSTIGRIYQIGLEGELYYIGAPVIGDHFGPARYRDTVKLRSSPDELAEHLRSLGADHLLIDLLRYPNGFNIDADDPLFAKYFELVRETPRAALYRIRNSVNYT